MNKTCPPNRFFAGLLFSVSALFLFPSIALAAAPDGVGPWADAVVSTAQGLRKDGSAVPAIRSNPLSALGVAENDTVDGHFYSLGFGGKITLKFDNTQSGGVMVVEATNPGYPAESAKIEVSEDGSHWVTAGNVVQDGQVTVPRGVCVQFARITDTSNPANFSDATADGYDVDGVSLSGKACKPHGSTNTVTVTNINNCTVSQGTKTTVISTIKTGSNTGNNTISNTTGGSNSIVTGDATSTSSVTVTGGSNTATTTCCGSTGSTSITIQGNG